MLAVVQRVSEASVLLVDTQEQRAIAHGLCILLGVVDGDTTQDAAWTAKKIAQVRIFADEAGKMNRSVRDVEGAVLLVSQFTLAGDCTRGNRPSFTTAMPPGRATPLYEAVIHQLKTEYNVPITTGRFGATMRVTLANEGPVTLVLDSHRSRRNNPDS